MSQTNVNQGAAVVNKGYFDVPICNQYSNKDVNRNKYQVDQYLLNRQIQNTLNSNHDEYIVDNYPNVPSPSLYTESDIPKSRYYNKDYIIHYPNEHFENESNGRHIWGLLLIIFIAFILFFSR